MSIVYESLPTLPSLAASIVICCIYIMLAGLAIWLSARAGIELIKLYRKTLAAEYRLEHMRKSDNREEVNFWIRENFRNKRQAAAVHEEDQKALAYERNRADQAEYSKRQIAQGQAYMERRTV